MLKRSSEAHVRSFRLATLGMRRDFLRELRGDYVTKSRQCGILTEWAEIWAGYIDEVKGIIDMPTNKNGRVQPDWKGFKDFRLTQEQLDNFALWEVHDDDLMDLIQTCLTEGYKLTLTYNSANDAYNASLTCNAEKHVNQGFTLSAFGPGAYIAMRLLMYKHWELLEGDWNNVPAPSKGGMG